MATATARKVDDDHYRTLAESAARNGHSISAELREWIAEGARKREAEKLLADMRDIRRQTKGQLKSYPGSVALIRAVRDEG